eukprot:5449064-Prymnesium_polylepis.1
MGALFSTVHPLVVAEGMTRCVGGSVARHQPPTHRPGLHRSAGRGVWGSPQRKSTPQMHPD